MHYIEIEKLLESGAHFGHLTRRWNPKMAQFIFSERNGIHIIDLRKSQILIDLAREAIYDIASRGKIVLFVGTKNLAKGILEREAKRCNMNYVSERWLGGMLTNFTTIRKSIKRLNSIDKMEVDGTFERITKKERLMINRERDRLRKFFGGIEEMTRLPGALFVVDIKKEHIAVNEAKILGIPVIAIVDTNCDPETVDYPIPANDDSLKTIDLIATVLADAINEGTALAKVRMAELASDGERAAKEGDTAGKEESPVIKRKMRERRGKRENRQDFGNDTITPGKETGE
ncbi:MAG: ribosomal protein [Ignavibacteria bacterium]|nr:ribosomal protein [Ignavibacteria bacterium]